MTFNPENKPTYKEMAPSLQKLFDIDVETNKIRQDLNTNIQNRKTTEIDIYEKITDLVNQDKNIQDSIDALSKSIDTKLSNMTTTINNYRDPCSGTCNWSCQTGCKTGCKTGCTSEHSGSCSTR